jgi:hypothetical protein
MGVVESPEIDAWVRPPSSRCPAGSRRQVGAGDERDGSPTTSPSEDRRERVGQCEEFPQGGRLEAGLAFGAGRCHRPARSDVDELVEVWTEVVRSSRCRPSECRARMHGTRAWSVIAGTHQEALASRPTTGWGPATEANARSISAFCPNLRAMQVRRDRIDPAAASATQSSRHHGSEAQASICSFAWSLRRFRLLPWGGPTGGTVADTGSSWFGVGRPRVCPGPAAQPPRRARGARVPGSIRRLAAAWAEPPGRGR